MEQEKHEKTFWEKYFKDVLLAKKNDKKHGMQDYFNALADEEYSSIMKHELSTKKKIRVLEAGCGEGGACLGFREKIEKLCLLDISESALECARLHSSNLCSEDFINKIEYIRASIFNIPYPDENFDHVRNCGVVEHYDNEHISRILCEMWRVTKKGGCVFVGIPNIYSLPVIKARILGSAFGRKYLTFIKGYRNTTERQLSVTHLKSLMEKSIPDKERKDVRVVYYGSPLLEGCPKIFLKICRIFFSHTKLSFIAGCIVTKKEY